MQYAVLMLPAAVAVLIVGSALTQADVRLQRATAVSSAASNPVHPALKERTSPDVPELQKTLL